MLDRLEIYPYQRVAEQPVRKPKSKKTISIDYIKKLMGGSKTLITANRREAIKDLVTVENIVLVIAAVIMARAFILGDLLPFIFAFVAAFGFVDNRKAILLAVAGTAGFATVLEGYALWSNIVALFALVGVLYYITIPDERKWWALPFMVSASIILVKTVLLLTQGLTFYNEMVVIFEALLAGILTFVLVVASDVVKARKPLVTFSFEEIAAFMILGIGIIMGLNDVYIGSLSLTGILCKFTILVAAFLWGSGGGTMVGVMAGVIPSVASSIFAHTLGMYAVAGLLAGLFKNFGRVGVIIGFMLGAMGISFFIQDINTAILGLWEAAIASIVFFLLPSSLKEKVPIQSLGPISNLKEKDFELIDGKIKEAAQNRIHHLAGVFDELSSTFTDEQTIKVKNNKELYLNYLYEELSQGFCEGCSRHHNCWDKDSYNTSQELLDLFTIAETYGQIEYENCSIEFKRRCLYSRDLISTVNYLFDNLRMNEYWTEKLEESRGLVANQLKGVSHLIKGLAEEIDIKTVLDFELREKLFKETKNYGLNIKELNPIRTNGDQLYINIITDSCTTGDNCELNISQSISSIMGEKMEVCEKRCPHFMGKGSCEFTLTRSFNYKVISGAAQVAKDKVCGDSFTIATLKEGKELIALSDGMGVGEVASTESKTAVGLLENLLNSGFNKEISLKTINSALLLRSTNETFATIDMTMIDLYTAEVDFIKIGCAPSYIKRGKKVGVVTSNSLPAGILDDVEVKSQKRSLCPKDMLVMVSDGVLENARGKDGEEWLMQLLSNLNEDDPQIVAETILNHALAQARGIPNDDMSVICMYIDLNFPN
ncbi:Stage II sporulation serine phosphatase for sigma-F activation (SpoIIE) [Candidatus Syntrophocurvum alkaliphilum]|uniref:Stage II sporulation serine phosphatase for sigma-F activation (SpoIIE) n=1 Tax=Candidatus Syntrophocurvum alkaliphilum TaxID=2293317 RepID=A0A6I6DKQ8_9FIRM|nr:stage II sporulation protein E [Candidatus Syntrophocurvum alkaliphilum]QGU00517.1 Stage II sporulation serine phosphatase for sigma-F activation (SpoIIE) [Candidatus Syntrophocurvum alkaliphilum]